eukprot:TRINITY_DN1817_c0_g2_i1.p1 TRINITY_DN1817_c0_g2~~TRINITY_DN1817_c0_g2_i1.p1  ORF type:complete len:781 (+),score=216.57 TRINITY_DN1817_c0_g2_i1:53-2395(+)
MRSFLLLLAAAAVHAVQWTEINCPGGDGNCNYQNQGNTDQIVSLFFQVELQNGVTDGYFQCSSGDVTYCSRRWTASETGSAGDCFFLLPAGGQFQCQSQGTIHFIGSHAAPLAANALTKNTHEIPCSSGTCTYTNKLSTDLWVAQSFETNEPSLHNSFNCKYSNLTVCNYAVNGTGGYSCGYVLPAGATVTCKANGQFDMRGSVGLEFAKTYLSNNAQTEAQWNCPLVSYPKPNMCDCAYTNPHNDKDLIVMVTSSSTNGDYNSFHCAYEGTNVCAWGSNQNNNGDEGGCYFILPPGTEFSCQMQWGAASFSISTAVMSETSLFGAFKKSTKKEWKRPATTEEIVERNLPEAQHKKMFNTWKAHHNKKYESPMEEVSRFNNFRKHLTAFFRVNGNNSSAIPNSLADWTKAEFETHLRDCSKPMPAGAVPPLPTGLVITEDDIKAIPESVDWRTKGVVTPIKNQGQCGSCWSFSTTGVIEGAWAMAGNKLQSLSEQELVSCEENCDKCDGGWPYLAIQYVQQHGDATEASYPYVSGNGNVPPCTGGHTMADVKVTGYFMVNNSEDAMAAAVAKYGPMSISLDAMTQLWWPYTGGIMTGCCNHAPDHAVLLVGYGVDQGTKYWLIKNSWGADWGEDGYIRLERGSNQCGITSAPTLAFVQGGPPMPQPTCPPETVVTNNTDGTRTCEWRNNTKGVIIPPPQSLNADCSYWPKENSFSYIWDGSVSPPANYPCPPSSEHQEQGAAENFCVFYNGAKGLHIPTTATVDCSNLISQGRFSYTFRP